MQVLLTGATGFIGQPLARALLGRGWRVRALVRSPHSPPALALARAGVELAHGDLCDRDALRAAMAAADLVINNAGVYELGGDSAQRARMRATNVAGAELLFAVAAELGVGHTTHISSVAAFGPTGSAPRDETAARTSPPLSDYERTKDEAHQIARSYQARGLALSLVCPAPVVGPDDHSTYGYLLRLYLNRRMPPAAWSPGAINSFVHVDDLAAGVALVAAARPAGACYILAGDPIDRRGMVACWAAEPGGMAPRIWLPPALAAALFAPLPPIQRRLGLAAFLSREAVVSGAQHWSYSSAKARAELGWRPRAPAEMWRQIFARERELRAARPRRDLASLLRPIAHG